MDDFIWNGKTIDDPKGKVDLSLSDGCAQEVCCDCGLGHILRTDATWASWTRVEPEDVKGVPDGRKFPLRELLIRLQSENARLKEKLSECITTLQIFADNFTEDCPSSFVVLAKETLQKLRNDGEEKEEK